MAGDEVCGDVTAELEAAIDAVLSSTSAKKLIVAGPGAGKTTLFRKLLEALGDEDRKCLVLTFINNLKDDLEQDLAGLAQVSTVHSYCLGLLKAQPALLSGLSPQFRCCPGLAHLIKRDWECLEESVPPKFVEEMRNLTEGNNLTFYFERAQYYDAVDFDDMVYRVYQGFASGNAVPDTYDLVLIDEYQDFNQLEAGFIDYLGRASPIVITGDDDQALYSRLRASSSEYIRLLHADDEFEVFELPFCMRCPEVVVAAVDDVIRAARDLGLLEGRISKPYRYFPPVKETDSARYPRIRVVKTSVQREGTTNYMGRYIEQAIRQIPLDEIEEASEKGYPAALVIASEPYRRQVIRHLCEANFAVDTKRDEQERLTRDRGLELLQEEEVSNLGWRIVLEIDSPDFLTSAIRDTAAGDRALADVLPVSYKSTVLADARSYAPPDPTETGEPDAERDELFHVKVTSFEGAKGLSAQHVYIVGLHDGDIPLHQEDIQDLEVCKFIVGLTRTRKLCTLMHTGRFAGVRKTRSTLIGWISGERLEQLWVNRTYWQEQEPQAGA